MRIACPNCSSEYDVPDSLLAAGPRQLRCARCGHQFQAGAAVSAPAVAASPAPAPAPIAAAPEPEPEPPAAAPRMEPPPMPAAAPGPDFQDRLRELERFPPAPRTGAPVAAGWVLSFAVLVACGFAGYWYHAEIVEAWPPAARLYQAIGIQ